MREEEANDDCWFMLPEEDDEETNWMDFKVGITGPVSKIALDPGTVASPRARIRKHEFHVKTPLT